MNKLIKAVSLGLSTCLALSVLSNTANALNLQNSANISQEAQQKLTEHYKSELQATQNAAVQKLNAKSKFEQIRAISGYRPTPQSIANTPPGGATPPLCKSCSANGNSKYVYNKSQKPLYRLPENGSSICECPSSSAPHAKVATSSTTSSPYAGFSNNTDTNSGSKSTGTSSFDIKY
jgi:hypothetical protein